LGVVIDEVEVEVEVEASPRRSGDTGFRLTQHSICIGDDYDVHTPFVLCIPTIYFPIHR
jgi:hypothetical protein